MTASLVNNIGTLLVLLGFVILTWVQIYEENFNLAMASLLLGAANAFIFYGN